LLLSSLGSARQLFYPYVVVVVVVALPHEALGFALLRRGARERGKEVRGIRYHRHLLKGFICLYVCVVLFEGGELVVVGRRVD